jgi:hypothetical protein
MFQELTGGTQQHHLANTHPWNPRPASSRSPAQAPKSNGEKTCWDFDFGSCEGSKQQAEHRSALLRLQCPRWLQHAIMTEKGWILLGETEGVMPLVVLFGVWTRLEGQLLELRCAAGSDGADDPKWGPGWVSVIRPQLDHLQVATLYCMTTNCHVVVCEATSPASD